MSSDENLRRALDGLSEPERLHHERLVATTALLADISFADILVLVPTVAAADEDGGAGGDGERRVVVTAHSRPITSQTVHPDDLFGLDVDAAEERPLAALALRTGVSTNGGAFLPYQDRWVQSLAVPVNFANRTIAVLLREFRR